LTFVIDLLSFCLIITSLLKNHDIATEVKIADIGCGDGEVLRACADYLRKHNYTFSLIGVDANSYILEEAKKRSVPYPEISFRTLNIFSEEIKTLQVDISLCTLFLHHFSNEDIIKILKISPGPKIGYILNVLLSNVLNDPKENKKQTLEKEIKKLNKLKEKDFEKLVKQSKQEIAKIEIKREQMTKKKYWVT
jgi:SAM-dependent methyltransferase